MSVRNRIHQEVFLLRLHDITDCTDAAPTNSVCTAIQRLPAIEVKLPFVRVLAMEHKLGLSVGLFVVLQCGAPLSSVARHERAAASSGDHSQSQDPLRPGRAASVREISPQRGCQLVLLRSEAHAHSGPQSTRVSRSGHAGSYAVLGACS
eukprot:15338946-Ditylum_brightwellii.AAC.1